MDSTFELQLVGRRRLSPTVWEIAFRPPTGFNFIPGQYINLLDPSQSGFRSYSIASKPGELLSLCIRILGDTPLDRFLTGAIPGEKVRAQGPFGSFVFHPSPKNQVFMANGTGISPIHSMIQAHLREALERPSPEGPKHLLIYGCRSEQEVFYKDELLSLSGLETVIILSQPSPEWKGERGLITKYLAHRPGIDWKNTEFYLCGYPAMVQEARGILDEHGVPRECIHHD